MKAKVRTTGSMSEEQLNAADPTESWPIEELKAAIKEGDDSGESSITSAEEFRRALAHQESQSLEPLNDDEDYIQSLIAKASDSWASVDDPDKWLQDLRGGYDA